MDLVRRYGFDHTEGSVNPTTKQLLSARVHHSMKERGVDLSDVLRQKPKEAKYELTPSEKMKLEKKRQKNRLHAKQSRERRNFNFAKTEKENRILKKEVKILRTLIGVYYRQMSKRHLAWTEVEVDLDSPPPSSSFQSSDSLYDIGSYHIMLPQDVTRMLLPAGRSEPFTMEEVLTLVQCMETCERKGPIKEVDNNLSRSKLDESIIAYPNVHHAPKIDTRFSTSLNHSPSLYRRPWESDFSLDGSSPDTDEMDPRKSFDKSVIAFSQDVTSPKQRKPENLWQGFAGVAENRRPTVTGKTCSLNETNDTRDQSPWMVNSKSEEILLEFPFNKRVDGKEDVQTFNSPGKEKPRTKCFHETIKQSAMDSYFRNNKSSITTAATATTITTTNNNNNDNDNNNNNNSEAPKKRTRLVRPMVENANTYTSEDTDTHFTFDLDLTPENSEATALYPNGQDLSENEAKNAQTTERIISHYDATTSPNVTKKLIENVDFLLDDPVTGMSIDETTDFLQFECLNFLEEVMGRNIPLTSRDIFINPNTEGGNNLAFEIQNKHEVTQNFEQYDPVSNLSSLSLGDIIFEEADALEPSFSLEA